jgi:flagellar basal-body rod modification protein FlgD
MVTLPIDTTSAAAQAESSAPSRELGRDEFLRLLVAKLENQDPLNPATDTEFVAQLATFSSLEQLISVNDNLEAISGSQSQLINAQALDLIGKEALVESGNSLRIKDGQPDTIVYAIPQQARDATLTLIGPDGAPVRVFELETTPSGRLTLDWDGTDEDGEPLADGDYTIKLNVTDAEGDPMSIALFRSLHIDGVSFFAGEIALVSGDREIPFERILEIREG